MGSAAYVKPCEAVVTITLQSCIWTAGYNCTSRGAALRERNRNLSSMQCSKQQMPRAQYKNTGAFKARGSITSSSWRNLANCFWNSSKLLTSIWGIDPNENFFLKKYLFLLFSTSHLLVPVAAFLGLEKAAIPCLLPCVSQVCRFGLSPSSLLPRQNHPSAVISHLEVIPYLC